MSHPPLTICFVGRKDTMRSPFAARYCVERAAPGTVKTLNFGTEARSDVRISPAMAAELIVRGIDTYGTCSHPLGRRVERSDLVLAMDHRLYEHIAWRYPAIRDRLFTLGQLVASLDECVAGLSPVHLIEQAKAVGEDPLAIFDVPDPAGGSRDQATLCAHIIEDYLDLILDALGLVGRPRRADIAA